MGKIMLNGRQYGVGGIADASDVKYGSTDVESALDTLNSSLTQLGKIYRFEATGGAVSANGRIPFTNSYVADNSIYVDGTSIKFRRSGTVRVDINIAASVSTRLWLLIHGNLNHHFISYGEYATCTSSLVMQVSDVFEFYITAKEACTVNGGNTSPATVFFTWMN